VLQAGGKFTYANVDSASSSHSLKSALEMLVQAGLAYKIHHTSARGLPLGAQVNPKRFKVILFDVGLHQRLLGLDLKEYLVSDEFEAVNKGNLAEVLAGLELIGNAPPTNRPPLYYWHRESRASNAEIDYLIQRGKDIVPIEVKAGRKGQMQSMFIFLKERNLKSGIRVSLENFGRYGNIDVIPLYAIGGLSRT
jgi:predicted AAA+ superfamily ATPase